MAYNPYPYPQYGNQFQPYNAPCNSPNYSPDTGMIWVKGEAGASSFPVQNGKSVVLFDSDGERFFIKTVDLSGMPQPLRTFKYSEVTMAEKKEESTSEFITRKEFDDAIESLKNSLIRKESKPNGKSSVQ